MPKTTVDENYGTTRRENKIRPTGKVFGMNSITKAKPVELPPNQ
jgi:hypothetical protein